MTWYQLLILFCAAVLGGAVNAVAGGGTLLTFPALILVGQPAIIANATNTVALWPGALSSFWGYRSELGYHRREILFLSVPSFLGGVLGAWLLVITDDSTFDILVPYLILLATGLFIVQEPFARWQRRRAEPSGEGAQAERGIRRRGRLRPCRHAAPLGRRAAVAVPHRRLRRLFRRGHRHPHAGRLRHPGLLEHPSGQRHQESQRDVHQRHRRGDIHLPRG